MARQTSICPIWSKSTTLETGHTHFNIIIHFAGTNQKQYIFKTIKCAHVRAYSRKTQFFKILRKPFLDIHTRNVMPKFESSKMNGVAVITKTYIHTYIHTHPHTHTQTAELR